MTKVSARKIAHEILGISGANISTEVLGRFMSQDELTVFFHEYGKNRRGIGIRDKTTYLKRPVTQQEERLLRLYFSDETKTTAEIAEMFKDKVDVRLDKTNVGNVCARIAFRLFYQNQSKFGW